MSKKYDRAYFEGFMKMGKFGNSVQKFETN